MHDHAAALEVFRQGTVIPATPLALREDRTPDEETQRLLMRYYLHAGAGGIATAVHSTQFAIREKGYFERVITIVSEETDRYEARSGRAVCKICGVCGPTGQAVREAELARAHGYDAVLLSPGGLGDKDETYLLARTREVSRVMPVIGFYLQPAVGGRVLSYDYWRALADTENVIGIKCASFHRYTTLDVMRAVCASARRDEITMYTGNDDNIVGDLLSEYAFPSPEGTVTKRFEGGLLGHWCIWTKKAVELLEEVRLVRAGGSAAHLMRLAPRITDMNAAAFDGAHNFAGCIPGIHEVLRRQGLMKNILCLDPAETLSAGQAEELDRVTSWYPELTDDDFIREHVDEWRREG